MSYDRKESQKPSCLTRGKVRNEPSLVVKTPAFAGQAFLHTLEFSWISRNSGFLSALFLRGQLAISVLFSLASEIGIWDLWKGGCIFLRGRNGRSK